jgi:hypothetical protein
MKELCLAEVGLLSRQQIYDFKGHYIKLMEVYRLMHYGAREGSCRWGIGLMKMEEIRD